MRPTGDGLADAGAQARMDAEFRRIAGVAGCGDLSGARTALHRLADRAEAAGLPVAAGRALRLAAALNRVLGDVGDAVAAATRAVELCADDQHAGRAALDELGESLLRAGQPGAAADAFGRAARLSGGYEPLLLRKQAYALTAGQDGPLWAAAQAAVEAAADVAADAGQAPALRADLSFLAAVRALDAGDGGTALKHVRAARRHALDGVAPLAYLAACVAESALSEALGDDEVAYGSLATGYATLGDLVGRELSADTFGGLLSDLRARWGAERFAAAKAAYEGARRR